MTNAIPAKRASLGGIVLGAVAIWASLVAALSAVGAFAALPLMLFPGLVALLLAGAVSTYFLSRNLRDGVERVGLRRLTAVHIWRIPAALAFFHYGAQGMLPSTFVALAGWGDLLAGVLALLVVTLLPRSRRAYWAFHVIGMADFLIAVGTGLTFALLMDPRMETIALFPMALIPLFGVTLSGATHIAAFDMLRRGRGIDDMKQSR